MTARHVTRGQRRQRGPEYRELEALIETMLYVTDLVTRTTTSIARLRALLIGACTETTRDVLARVGVTPETPSSGGGTAPPAYAGAQRITHPHLHPGDACPRCDTGKVYQQRDPKVLERFVRQAPIGR